MIRFILERKQVSEPGYDSKFTAYETLDVEVPELEMVLKRGGFSQYGCDTTKLIGCEVIIKPKEKL